MRYQWLKNKSNSDSVIVLFSGWGFDHSIFSHLVKENDGFDVLFVQDYRVLDLVLPDLRRYKKRCLIAWSFGVAAFSTWKALFDKNVQDVNQDSESAAFHQLIAINGTMQAIDRSYGVPERVMLKTINTLSEQSFEVFAKRCFVQDALPSVSINVLEKRQELELILSRKHFDLGGWDRVWISKHDKIFPTKNLIRAWQAYNDTQDQLRRKTVEIKYCDAPHAPFHLWSHWEDIVSS